MAIMTVAPFLYPTPPPSVPMWTIAVSNFSGGFSCLASGSGKHFGAIVLEAEETGDIEGFEYQAQWASGANPYRISLQDVTAAGIPDGVQDAYVDVASPSNGWKSVTFNATKAVTRGQRIAVVWQWTATQSGDIEVFTHPEPDARPVASRDYFLYSGNGTSWTTVSAHMYPAVALRYSGGVYYPSAHYRPPFTNVGANRSFNSGSTPDEYAVRFTAPAALRVRGLWAGLTLAANCDLVLYDNTGTAIGTVSLDSDEQVQAINARPHRGEFATPVTLTQGDVYRVAVKPLTTTNVTLHERATNAAALTPLVSPGATGISSRSDGGAWTDTDTAVLPIGVIVDGVDTGSGGGGTSGYSRGRVVNG